MTVCEECGLSIAACNAMALWQRAYEAARRGRMDEADSYAEYAKEDYARHMEQYRAAPSRER